MATRVAFIGLGAMGGPMAGHVQNAGLALRVYNRSEARRSQWALQHGDQAVCDDIGYCIDGADVVLLCLGADDDVREVVMNEAVLPSLKAGAVLVDHSTTSADLAREMARAAQAAGCYFLDAPVSGGVAGAESGQLTLMAGGDEAAWHQVQPVLNTYAARMRLLGPAGSGQLCKMVNQTCIAGLVQGLAEGLHFARTAGLDEAAVIDVISAGAAQSWQMDNRWQTMVAGEYEFGFAVDWMRKDLRYVLGEARRNGAQLPVTALVDQFYAELQQRGAGRFDTSSLLYRLQPVEKDGSEL